MAWRSSMVTMISSWPGSMGVPASMRMAPRGTGIGDEMPVSRIENLSTPSRLEEAMGQVPKDPFDGQPLRYKKAGNTFVVYSIGPTGKFDGGTPAAKPDAKEALFRYPMPPYMK